MFKELAAFSSFSTNDLLKAKEFYGSLLGIEVIELSEMALLELHFANGSRVMIYPKDDHIPATYTVLNFPVSDIDSVVTDLTKKGIVFEQYNDPSLKTDDRGISTNPHGPRVAWFKDPSGNILAIIEDKE